MADFPLTKTAQAIDDALNEIDGAGQKFVNDFKTAGDQSIETAANQAAAALPKSGGALTGSVTTQNAKDLDTVIDNADAGNIGKDDLGASGLTTDADTNLGAGFNFYDSAAPSLPIVDGCYMLSLPSQFAALFAQITITSNDDRAYFRRNNSALWQEFLHTGNTTVDGSGFIKEASPIIKLFSDKIEMNSLCSGDESLTHDKTGIYLISNCSGFSENGWYIETPKDANNNVKVFVEYEQLETKDILIKTYEPDYSSGKISAGEPCDITVDRWIDIRLNPIKQIDEEEE